MNSSAEMDRAFLLIGDAIENQIVQIVPTKPIAVSKLNTKVIKILIIY